MVQAGISGLAERSLMSSGKRKSTKQQVMSIPQSSQQHQGVHEVMKERGKQKHPSITDAVYQLGFAKTNSS